MAYKFTAKKMDELDKTRIDKWLWAIRIYKSRSLASEACGAGKIKIEGDAVKASYLIKPGQTIHINKQGEKKILKVVKLIEKRVGAPLAITCFEDLTPPEELNKLQFPSVFYEVRDKGIGRPTKKDRRNIDKFKDTDS
ncbi:MAG TPA: RNA-binding S4 domain-containing protein [Chitinophagales bacterium]|jgi:ribosome-associated heat shock protein Hsp15|nr:RNA-binding S4 domain-containing protein [Chitinophagales bacterium]